MVNDKTNINVLRSTGNVVLEKNAQSIVDRKENQFRHSKYSKKYKKAYKQRQEKTSRISRPCDEKGKARAFVDNRKDRRKKKQRSSTNKNTRRYSSLAGKKHCGDVCGCKRSRKVEGHDRLRLQQTRQLKKKKSVTLYYYIICGLLAYVERKPGVWSAYEHYTRSMGSTFPCTVQG